MTNGIESEGRASPGSSLSDGGISNLSDSSENGRSVRSDSGESAKDVSDNRKLPEEDNYERVVLSSIKRPYGYYCVYLCDATHRYLTVYYNVNSSYFAT